MTQSQERFPSVAPQNEVEAANESSFADACRARVANEATKFGWHFGNSIVTRSDTWGLVWRVDFRTSSQLARATLVNRLICWQATGETNVHMAYVFGQPVDPLK